MAPATSTAVAPREQGGRRQALPTAKPSFDRFGRRIDYFLRFRLRTLQRVNIEAQLVATGQNVKRLLTERGGGRHPWPASGAGITARSAPATYAFA